MTRNTCIVAFAILAAALPVAGSAQDLTAEQILAKAYERYASIKDFQATVNESIEAGSMKAAASMQFAYRRPNMVYVSTSSAPTSSVVQDGKTRWTYLGSAKQYTQERVKPEEGLTDREGMAMGPAGQLMAVYLLEGRALTRTLERPRLLPEAEVQGRQCYVVDVKIALPGMPAPADFALSFDKESMILLAGESYMPVPGAPGGGAIKMHMSESYRDVKIGQGIPDDRFTFQPPAGAKLVNEFGPQEREKPKLLGKPAPDFKVKDLSGKTVALGDFKGKVLLLDFWATWCPPCKKEMPDIQRIHEQGNGKGLSVLAVSDEDAGDVRKFLKQQHLTIPVGIDESGDAGTAYGVQAIPSTFLIDGKGVVRGGFIGLASGTSLAEEISRLGVKVEPPGELPPTEREIQVAAAGKRADAGLKLFMLGRDVEAGKELKAAADAVPGDVEGWLTLGEFYVKTSQPGEAAAAFDRALAAAGEAKHAVHGAAAKAYLDAGIDRDAALEHAREAVRLEPRVAEYWNTLGWACYQKEMYEQAVFNLGKAVKIAPRDSLAHYRLGAAYEKRGEEDQALAEYKEAAKLDPSLDDARKAVERLEKAEQPAPSK